VHKKIMGLFIPFISILIISFNHSNVISAELGLPSTIEIKNRPPDYTNWSGAEKKVWDAISSGKPAIFDKPYLVMNIERQKAQSLRSAFLSKILCDEKICKLIPHNGVQIECAIVNGELDLRNAGLNHMIRFESCIFRKNIQMGGVVTPHGISLKKSSVEGDLFLTDAEIGGSLNLDGGTFCALNARNLKVDGTLSMQRANFRCRSELTLDIISDRYPSIDLLGASIGGQLNMEGAWFMEEVRMPGIQVNGQMSSENAKFDDGLFMPGSIVDRRLCLKNIRGAKKIFMQGVQVKNRVDLDEAKITGVLDMQGMDISNRLFMDDLTVSGDLLLKNSKIDNCLSMKRADIAGQSDFQGLNVKGDVIMQKGRFNSVNLTTGQIEGLLNLSTSGFSGKVVAYGLYVKNTLQIEDATFSDILHMQRSKVAGLVDLRRSEFRNKVSFKGAEVDGDFYLDDAKFNEELDMLGVRINGNAIINQGEFKKGILLQLGRITSVDYKGANMSRMDLKGTYVDTIIARVKNSRELPQKMELRGFTYDIFLGEYTGQEEKKEEFFQNWLRRIEAFAPQPYEQCAKALREAGSPEKANAVLYAAKERAREEAWVSNKKRWLGLSILKVTIGYGLGVRYFLALLWIAVFVLIGTLVSYKSSAKEVLETKGYTRWSHYFFYSLDMLLPLIKLRDQTEKIELPDRPRRYFYFHKLAGWLLLSFVLAGLAGITQM